MAEYIEREAAIDACFDGWNNNAHDCADNIRSIPAADVRPVVRGKWEWNDNNGYYYCGNCKAASPREDQDGEYIDCPNFCPNCGADMREES